MPMRTFFEVSRLYIFRSCTDACTADGQSQFYIIYPQVVGAR